MSDESQEHVASLSRILWVVGVIWAFAIFAVLWIVNRVPTGSVPTYSLVGDFFAVASVLVSAFAFVAFYISIRLQRQQLRVQSDELRLQREELEQTRAELRGQKEQLEAQNITLRQQRFETSFFELLKIYDYTLDRLTMTERSKAIKARFVGRDAFEEMNRVLKSEFKGAAMNSGDSEMDTINKVFMRNFLKYESDFGYYFRTLYNIIKFIDQSEIENSKFYTNLIRSRLSLDELILIFYDCLSEKGREKFKPLAEKYSLFKQLDASRLFARRHEDLIDPLAFGKSES